MAKIIDCPPSTKAHFRALVPGTIFVDGVGKVWLKVKEHDGINAVTIFDGEPDFFFAAHEVTPMFKAEVHLYGVKRG